MAFTLPDPVVFISCAIDVQERYLQRLMIGWAETSEAWMLEADTVEGEARRDPAVLRTALEEVAAVRFAQPGGGEPMLVHLCGMDVGFLASQVHAAVRQACAWRPLPRWVYATKGRGGISGTPIVQMREEVDLHGRRGQRYLQINTDDAKQELVEALQITTPGPGCLHIPKRIGTTEFLAQLTSEERVTKFDGDDVPVGNVWKKTRARNEALDLTCINIALFHFVRSVDWLALLRRRYGVDEGDRRLQAMR